jgi:hypothetical protein
MGVFSSVLTGSLQGIAERPLPCNFHGGNTGSNPVGDAKHSKELSRFHSGWLGFKKVQFCWNAINHSRSPCYRPEGSTRSRTEIR